MEFRVLGPLEVVADAGSLPLGGPKQRAVLAELILQANTAVSRQQLIDALWAAAPPKTATGTLQVYVHGLRRTLGAERIQTLGTAYRLQVEPGELDLERHEDLVARARAALAQSRPLEAVEALEEALALWRGAPLSDLAGEAAASTAARELSDRRLSAIELRNDALLELGRHDLVLAEIERLIADNPYRERIRAHQILGLYRAGRQTEALDAYRSARESWVEELGVEPSPALQQLEQAVLRHDPALSPPSRPRLPPGRLPVPPTSLVGRRLEVAAVGALLRSEVRLVTLVGPGGTGKTRLALAVAETLAPEIDEGAVFVDLSSVSEPHLLLPTVAEALGVADTGRPLGEELADQLRDRSLLLVLDNLEQLLDGVSRLSELLAASPRLRILATSRAPLRLSGEHRYPVPPLPLPGPETTGAPELGRNEAVQLFLARARAADPSFALDERSAASVAAICRRLDGLPLALELAAARVGLLSPAQMLERLDREPEPLGSAPRDAPARHSTLGATIGWSYELLPERERLAFARLAVFAGGFTPDAAERVCEVDLDSLGALLDNSLLRRTAGDGARLTMLETVRRYALDRLAETGGADVRRRHAEWLVELAEAAEAELPTSADASARLDRLAAEHDNIRAALAWAVESGAVELALRLASALRPFWDIRGHLGEGARWLEEALAAAVETDTPEYGKAVGVSGSIAFHRGDYDLARERFQRTLDIFRALDRPEWIARALSDLGTVAAAVGDLDRAGELIEESASRFRQAGEQRRLAIALANLGHIAGRRSDHETAIEVTTEALAIQQELGDQQREAVSLLNLGTSCLELGRSADARRWIRECVALALELGYKEVLAYALAALVRMRAADGDHAAAALLAGAVDGVLAESGVALLAVARSGLEDARESAHAALGEDAYAAAHARGRALPVEAVLRETGALEPA